MMNSAPLPRRTVAVDMTRAAAAGWLTLQLPWLASLAACARDDARHDAAFAHLNAAEARTMRAFAAQVIPSDDGTPGADEAGAAYFVDRAFGMTFFADSVPVIREGLADLDARARTSGGRAGFASLPHQKQIALMRQIEATPFFATARTLVVIGMLADPSYGGNRGGAGWTMMGMEHRPSFIAPFGWYDTQVTTDSTRRRA